MQEELLQFIIQSTPKKFFEALHEKLPEAMTFARSDGERFPENERARLFGHAKNQRFNGAFREAAMLGGLGFAEGEKISKGECYTAYNPFMVFGKANLKPLNRFPAPAVYRRAIARLNEPFEPDTPDLFIPQPIHRPGFDRVGCLILPVIPPRHEPNLAGIYVGVPYSNLKDWHMYEPLTHVINAYQSAMPSEGLTDKAFAKLKKNLKRKEG